MKKSDRVLLLYGSAFVVALLWLQTKDADRLRKLQRRVRRLEAALAEEDEW